VSGEIILTAAACIVAFLIGFIVAGRDATPSVSRRHGEGAFAPPPPAALRTPPPAFLADGPVPPKSVTSFASYSVSGKLPPGTVITLTCR